MTSSWSFIRQHIFIHNACAVPTPPRSIACCIASVKARFAVPLLPLHIVALGPTCFEHSVRHQRLPELLLATHVRCCTLQAMQIYSTPALKYRTSGTAADCGQLLRTVGTAADCGQLLRTVGTAADCGQLLRTVGTSQTAVSYCVPSVQQQIAVSYCVPSVHHRLRPVTAYRRYSCRNLSSNQRNPLMISQTVCNMPA